MLRTLIFVQIFTALITALPLLPQSAEEWNKIYAKTLTELRKESSGYPDYSLGKKLEQLTPDSKVNPEELGSYFEGDILHDPLQDRNGLISTQFRWPDAVVPFVIHEQFNLEERLVITRAMGAYHDYTCIKFRPYQNEDRDYVSIEKAGAGCYSSVGRVGGKQVLNLQSTCLTRIGTPIHEMMHALGFFHEHSRLERDDYVDILWDNIAQGQEHNFSKRNSTGFGVEYDYGSVMHYSANGFSKNGQPTIQTKAPNVEIGQREGFSYSDIDKINIMYGC